MILDRPALLNVSTPDRRAEVSLFVTTILRPSPTAPAQDGRLPNIDLQSRLGLSRRGICHAPSGIPGRTIDIRSMRNVGLAMRGKKEIAR